MKRKKEKDKIKEKKEMVWVLFDLVSLFNGISVSIGYAMPNSFL